MDARPTYWFTIAAGDAYRAMAVQLAESLQMHGIDLHVLGHNSMDRVEAKHLKIEGILSAPSSCGRVVYLDADTLVLNPEGIGRVNGSWRIPWRISAADCIPKDLDGDRYSDKLAAFYRNKDLAAFSAGGGYDGVEWNSGVIVGDREWLVTLAQEWQYWWDRTLELFDGQFRRDQLSYRIAYYRTCERTGRRVDLPAAYNWVASYFGINPNANILHRTMVKNQSWLDEDWNVIAARLAAGDRLATKNRLFDFERIADVKPCLGGCVHADRHKASLLLLEAMRLARPKNVLVLGEPFQAVTDLLDGSAPAVTCLGLDAARRRATLADFDFVIFNPCRHAEAAAAADALKQDAVCCLLHGHRLEFYQVLFQFAYVRFLDYNMLVFSNSAEIVGWRFHGLHC